jgi:hypothetical protein
MAGRLPDSVRVCDFGKILIRMVLTLFKSVSQVREREFNFVVENKNLYHQVVRSSFRLLERRAPSRVYSPYAKTTRGLTHAL